MYWKSAASTEQVSLLAIDFGSRVYPMGSIVITFVGFSVGLWSVRILISQRPLISFFLKFCMKLGVIKVKKVTRPEF